MVALHHQNIDTHSQLAILPEVLCFGVGTERPFQGDKRLAGKCGFEIIARDVFSQFHINIIF
ncbi:MAG: hypothetical protein MJA29_03115 [Candidatus Omnitrophica bacterium]|nr:hypothetical protein [Candidatus Omnitrophota bacterium]